MSENKTNLSTPDFLTEDLEKLDGKQIQGGNQFGKNIAKGRVVIDEASQIMNSDEKLDLPFGKPKITGRK